MINFSTGPVNILPSVTEKFLDIPISHRSLEFKLLHKALKDQLCQKLNVKETFILNGSGTLANEIMITQIALRKDYGLIVSNGEFGDRLISQANRQQIDFETFVTPWGQIFDLEKIKTVLQKQNVKWLLLCHCESSTGVINALDNISDLCNQYGCDIYVDCMSTIGTMQLDLAKVAMASASSGKGIGCLAGLGLVFANVNILPATHIPLYLDLFHIWSANGIPFTLSSNYLSALNEAVVLNLNEKKWSDISTYSEMIYNKLEPLHVIPFATPLSKIFTITLNGVNATDVADQFLGNQIHVSYQSDYLIQRNWIQIALFSSYNIEDINSLLSACKAIFAK